RQYLGHGYAAGGRCAGADLAELLHIHEEKRLIAKQWTAHVAAELVLVVRWRARLPAGNIGIAPVAWNRTRVAVEEVPRLRLVVAVKLPQPAVKLPRTRLGHNIHLRPGALPELGRVVV